LVAKSDIQRVHGSSSWENLSSGEYSRAGTSVYPEFAIVSPQLATSDAISHPTRGFASALQITFVEARFSGSGPSLAYPSRDGGTGHGDFGGSFLLNTGPEPSAWAMILGGTGALGLMLQRQRAHQA
jgi:hypothetical protein